jgi:hypothetical protein
VADKKRGDHSTHIRREKKKKKKAQEPERRRRANVGSAAALDTRNEFFFPSFFFFLLRRVIQGRTPLARHGRRLIRQATGQPLALSLPADGRVHACMFWFTTIKGERFVKVDGG